MTRLELATFALTGQHSTPTELHGLIAGTGFEPATLGSSDRCSTVELPSQMTSPGYEPGPLLPYILARNSVLVRR